MPAPSTSAENTTAHSAWRVTLLPGCPFDVEKRNATSEGNRLMRQRWAALVAVAALVTATLVTGAITGLSGAMGLALSADGGRLGGCG
jgi:hypothetical protein